MPPVAASLPKKFCLVAGIFCGWIALSGAASERTPVSDKSENSANISGRERVVNFLQELLPTSLQSQPRLRFNAITEMTPEGRKRRVPSTSQPMYFYAVPARFVQTGEEVSAGEKPPSSAELEEALRKVLAQNGYLPIPDDHQRPDVLIVSTYGSSGAAMVEGALTADEFLIAAINARDVDRLARDVVERARLVAGDKFAQDLDEALRDYLRVYNPNNFPPPLDSFMRGYSRELIEHYVQMIFHTCYFVTATAYDFEGVAKKRKIPLWQTRMAIEANGVSMKEIFRPLIINTGNFIGREQDPSWVTQRLDRRGHVEIGDARVVEETLPTPSDQAVPDKAAPR